MSKNGRYMGGGGGSTYIYICIVAETLGLFSLHKVSEVAEDFSLKPQIRKAQTVITSSFIQT